MKARIGFFGGGRAGEQEKNTLSVCVRVHRRGGGPRGGLRRQRTAAVLQAADAHSGEGAPAGGGRQARQGRATGKGRQTVMLPPKGKAGARATSSKERAAHADTKPRAPHTLCTACTTFSGCTKGEKRRGARQAGRRGCGSTACIAWQQQQQQQQSHKT